MLRKLYLLVTSLHPAAVVSVRWIPRALIPDCGPSPNLPAPVYDMYNLPPNLTCAAPSCVTFCGDIFVGRGAVVSGECYAWKTNYIFKSILLGHGWRCYPSKPVAKLSLKNDFREQRELESIWYSQATVSKVKWLMLVFSRPIFFKLKKTALIMNADERFCDF